MKKIIILATLLLAGNLCFWSCTEDKHSDTSIFEDPTDKGKNAFDLWLAENYAENYNIKFVYRYDDKETDMSYNLVPPSLEKSIQMAKLIKFLWLDPYQEARDIHFMRTYAPRMIQLIGCAGYEGDGTIKLGTAEGGKKITLYVVNWLDPTDINKMNEYFFNTMHHEFGHILHQTIAYPREFALISAGDYNESAWQNRNETEAAELGFVSPYAGSREYDDFVEILARYLTYSDSQWSEKLSTAGTAGANKINIKLDMVRDYMQKKWKINLDQLRSILIRRYTELPLIDLDNI